MINYFYFNASEDNIKQPFLLILLLGGCILYYYYYYLYILLNKVIMYFCSYTAKLFYI